MVVEYVQQVQQQCPSCSKAKANSLLRSVCRCGSQIKKVGKLLTPKAMRRTIYAAALVNTIKTARTAASIIGATANPRMR